MSLRINTNVDALSSYKQAEHELGCGLAVDAAPQLRLPHNSAADDTAGLSISERMRGQIRGPARRSRTSTTVSRWLRTVRVPSARSHGMLQRVRELSVQFQNGSLSTTDRTSIQSEVTQLASEIERIGTTTAFNGIKLLNASGNVTFQVGANDSEQISVATISLGSAVGGVVRDAHRRFHHGHL